MAQGLPKAPGLVSGRLRLQGCDLRPPDVGFMAVDSGFLGIRLC